jgi:hypothetical protein
MTTASRATMATRPISPTMRASQVRTTAAGKPSMIEKKMRSDMPFPTPCSVICSPSHMMKMAPTVSASTVVKVKRNPGFTTAPSMLPTKTEYP